jgi:hypothetical protein
MKHFNSSPYFVLVSVLLLAVASCSKNNNNNFTNTIVNATPVKVGLYEADSSIYYELYTDISQIGTSNTEYDLLFDTGSGGMVVDAQGVVPASMVTSTGFNITGDSVTVNGITILNQKSTIVYGDDDNSTSKVYGNLAYTNVTIGDAAGNIVIKRLPFFLYYKAVDNNNNAYVSHYFDTFGVSSDYDISFPNGVIIQSPLSYFTPGTGLTKGFKMAALGTNNFSLNGNYIEGAFTVGLTAADLSSTSGFSIQQLTFEQGDGYPPLVPASITYNSKTVNTDIVFDTGTEPYSYIEDATYKGSTTLLPTSTPIAIAATNGFIYSYTITDTNNLTYVENPNTSGGSVSVLGLPFFFNNSYLLDYTDHKLGVKNN